MTDPLADLENLLRSRRTQQPEGSYSVQLFSDPEQLQRKIMEEAFEVCLELARASLDRQRVAEEAADLLFHLVAGLVAVEVSLADVEQVLAERRR